MKHVFIAVFSLSLSCRLDVASQSTTDTNQAVDTQNNTDTQSNDTSEPDETDNHNTDTTTVSDASPGCGEVNPNPDTSLPIEGKSRSFVLSIPNDYNPNQAYPLVFAWHGRGGSGSIAKSYFGLTGPMGDDAIVVYPNGVPQWSVGGDTGWDLNPNGDDFDFFDAMLEHLADSLCVDTSRVFSTGHSFGGYMSNTLGCFRGDVHNAIAPVAGGPYGSIACPDEVGVWLTHGFADSVVWLSEGLSALYIWQQANGCSSTSSDTDPSPCVAFDGCSRDVHWCEHTGGHEWPSFAGAAIWDFFSAQ